MSSLTLVGSHASTAMSPALWTRAFEIADVPSRYDAWEVADVADLPDVEDALRGGRTDAANVTMPWKHWAATVADEADPDVVVSGVANLLFLRSGALFAMNTDIAAVRAATSGRTFGSALLLGAGGAAHAAAFALQGHIERLVVSDVDSRAAEGLVGELDGYDGSASVVDWSDRAVDLECYDLVINATPIGRDGSEDQLVWGAGELGPTATVYDFVYADTRNAVESYAADRGIELIDGWTHLFHQADAMVRPLGLPARMSDALRRSIREICPAAAGINR
ncbi:MULTISPECIES: hypothetical protein [Rhodococcus]|jgi:shikimate dehydrogenase|uniref:Shikimate dehydrogenase substrate binding N-terminal domain-containing protein n=1 Tax=Rhodococcus cerastii TaxID=908616 RepID=A0ABU4D581_9NOCA|nr:MULTISPECIES: hypothetical protein [Rhodococcus]MDV6304890.1 hypothetical protein [Rhodococcus cerastii]MDV7989321.1 hypothetical protein [Rhodococcus sp. IEGM 1374]